MSNCQSKNSETLKIVGAVCITERDIVTGEILGYYEDPNVILGTGKASILRAMSIVDTNVHRVRTIKIGNDVGTGTILAPQDPTSELLASDQSVLYEVDPVNVNTTYPNQNSVRYSATLNGADVMAAYPALPNIVYTSVVLYTYDNTGVAYKRFPGRTISPLISIDISWTITIV